MSRVNVIVVKEPPTLRKPEIVSGFRDKSAVQAWAEKNGHATVYYLVKRQRVYVERFLIRVDEVAMEIESASVKLVTMAEGAL